MGSMQHIETFVQMIGLAAALFGSTATTASAQPYPGWADSDFTLKDAKGTPYVLSSMKDRQMTVLYFFDAASRPSQEGLRVLG